MFTFLLQDIASWLVSDVQWFLKANDFGGVASHFEEHGVDGKLLMRMSDAHLSGIGVADEYDRTRILRRVTRVKQRSLSWKEKRTLPHTTTHHNTLTLALSTIQLTTVGAMRMCVHGSLL